MPRTTKLKKNYIGIDPSFTGTGIVVLNNDGQIIEQELISTTNKNTTEERMILIAQIVVGICVRNRPANIYIEGLPYGKLRTSFAYQLGALHFFLKLRLHKKFNIVEVPPNKLKMFVGGPGKGNATKAVMLLQTFKRWGEEFNDDNLCDAYGLARFGIGK